MLRVELDVTPTWWLQATSDDVAATIGYLLRLFKVYEVHAGRDRLFLSRNLPADADLTAIDEQRQAIITRLNATPPFRSVDKMLEEAALQKRGRHG